eukprot:UN03586
MLFIKLLSLMKFIYDKCYGGLNNNNNHNNTTTHIDRFDECKLQTWTSYPSSIFKVISLTSKYNNKRINNINNTSSLLPTIYYNNNDNNNTTTTTTADVDDNVNFNNDHHHHHDNDDMELLLNPSSSTTTTTTTLYSLPRFIIYSKTKTKREICELFLSTFITSDEDYIDNNIQDTIVLLPVATLEEISEAIKTQILPHFIFRSLIHKYKGIHLSNLDPISNGITIKRNK